MATSGLAFLDFVRLVLDAIEQSYINYCIGGAIALWAWGEPRTTQDFDLVIDLPGTSIVRLSEELKVRGMLVPPDIIIELLIQPEGDLPINAIHMDTGYKAELFLLREGDEFRRTALARRRLVDLGPPLGEVYVHAPEDLILYKIRYFQISEQTKHVRDIASIMVSLGQELDTRSIDEWVDKLDLHDAWTEVQRQVEVLLDDSTEQ